MKRFALALLLVAASAIPGLAQSQSTEPAAQSTSAPFSSWPPKTVHIIVPFAAGSTPDAVARIIGDGLRKKYPDATFVVEDRPGASGNIGTQLVSRAAPDGLTLLMTSNPFTQNIGLFKNVPYDPVTSFAPIIECAVGVMYEPALFCSAAMRSASR